MADYRTVLRWPAQADAGGVLVRLDCGVGAVEFLEERGREVSVVLCARNSVGPVFALPGHPVWWVLLSSPDDPGAGVIRALLVGT